MNGAKLKFEAQTYGNFWTTHFTPYGNSYLVKDYFLTHTSLSYLVYLDIAKQKIDNSCCLSQDKQKDRGENQIESSSNSPRSGVQTLSETNDQLQKPSKTTGESNGVEKSISEGNINFFVA